MDVGVPKKPLEAKEGITAEVEAMPLYEPPQEGTPRLPSTLPPMFDKNLKPPPGWKPGDQSTCHWMTYYLLSRVKNLRPLCRGHLSQYGQWRQWVRSQFKSRLFSLILRAVAVMSTAVTSGVQKKMMRISACCLVTGHSSDNAFSSWSSVALAFVVQYV
ncbi:hypothetical protein HU200_013589 [Digitaria exilis]|uniref:Uncharacterized protein n=1 Tax=Digitaria exilis TaxID=1010633 RepID=A0A835FDZ1_9POAL|nr:hypothetical protein HU200_013589 [Digitaria exilis]